MIDTAEQLAEILIEAGIITEDAWHRAADYDDGMTRSRLNVAFEKLLEIIMPADEPMKICVVIPEGMLADIRLMSFPQQATLDDDVIDDWYEVEG